MATFWLVLSWIFSIVLAFIAFLVLGMGGRIQFFLILGIVLLLFPPLRNLLNRIIGTSLPWWVRCVLILILIAGVVFSFFLNPATSIYKSPEYKAKLMAIYDAKLTQWPVPYESVFVDTKYGKIHVIISGPENAPPVLLIHASGLSGWSWIHNVKALNEKYCTYAIDNIGEGNKNEMKAPGKIPKTGQEIADFYTEISDNLGLSKTYVVGASIGGYISTSYALYAPERVEKLVLLGSMGYGFTPLTILTMMIAQGFPLKPVQEATFRWAFGSAPQVNESFGEWFRIYMKGTLPTPIPPSTFTPEQLRSMQVPVLAFFGTKDGVVGNSQKAKVLAQNIPGVMVEIVESGHVIGAELPGIVNSAIIDFFENSSSGKNGKE